MKTMLIRKYRPYPAVDLPGRAWPSRTITKAPQWCSVDLRDGNQALVIPMSVAEKLELFKLLVAMGFKEIEVGFPSASQVEYDFIRLLIEGNHIPNDVAIQVLTQAREHLITRTAESLKGVKRAVVHMYNSTSELQRRVVFRMDKDEIVKLAREGARLIKAETAKLEGSEIVYEYTPESFTGTELDFSLRISQAIMDVWQPTPARKMILNLPATVEMATPNVYADQIEWFGGQVKDRGAVILSVHAHNDRGTAVAATELALLAGADRVEGTLFGNGERTGNVDLVTLGMNLFSQGIDPGLDFSAIDRIVEVSERITRMPVPARQPYAGELVYTAFSGSHQDAINKGLKARKEGGGELWEVPYLPIDPADVGRTYEGVIRINSQSGKGGVTYVMEKEYGFSLPREMHPEFGRIVQAVSEQTGKELAPGLIRSIFEKEYLRKTGPLAFQSSRVVEPVAEGTGGPGRAEISAKIAIEGVELTVHGVGNGPIDAFSHALRKGADLDFRLQSYHEHALEQGSDSQAVAYISIKDSAGATWFGAGVDTSIDRASFKALISALNRSGAVRRRLDAYERENTL